MSKGTGKGTAIIAVCGGSVLLYSGIRGKKLSVAIRDILNGKNPSGAASANPITGVGTTGFNPSIPGNPTANAPANVSGNAALAKMLATPFGWGSGAQWNALYALWMRESGFNNHATNPNSGAYGIPQALPPSKMGPLANPPVSSATAQIAWGLPYIKMRYGDPISAEAHEQSAGWY